MKKVLLLKLLIVAMCVGGFTKTSAQNSAVLGPRLIVNSPSSIGGVKRFTFSSQTASSTWGRPLDSNWYNVEVVSAIDSDACGQVTGVTGKWALVHRGTCEFGKKALDAQTAGAKGVIIWDHTPGEPLVNMAAGASGAGVTIPVLFIANEDGVAMMNQLRSSQQVFISLTTWGFGKLHDLAFVPNSGAMTPGGAIPLRDLDGSDVASFRGYTGAIVANTGTSTETNVKIKNTTSFTPTGGSASVVYTDSATIASFPTTDSISTAYSSRYNNFAPTNYGTYNVHYDLSATAADLIPLDNVLDFSMEVTPNVYCRGKFDVGKQQPVLTGEVRPSTGGFVWGPLFYVKHGGYTAESVMFAVHDGDTSKHSLANSTLQTFASAYLFKWVDANSNSVMEPGELSMKSIAYRQFDNTDSNLRMTKATFGDLINGGPMTVTLEDNSFYWIAFDLPSGMALGAEADQNYYTRADVAANAASTKTFDFWAPDYFGDIPTLDSAVSQHSATDTIRMIPFGPTTANAKFIDSTSPVNVAGVVPAVAFFTSVFPTSVKNVSANTASQFNVFPNPATDQINVSYNLDKYSRIDFRLVDGLGRTIRTASEENALKGNKTISTKGLPSGNYYVVILNDGKAVSRQFTVVAK